MTRLGVDAGGLVDPAAVAAALRADTVLVSVMAANNEIGVLQPIAAIGAIARARGVAFHVDAAQAAGKVAARRRGDRRRPAVDQRAQVLRPEGRRRALRAAARPGRPICRRCITAAATSAACARAR